MIGQGNLVQNLTTEVIMTASMSGPEALAGLLLGDSPGRQNQNIKSGTFVQAAD